MHGFHELRGDSLASIFLQDAVKPAEEHVRFQLEAETKADRAFIQPGYEHQCVVAAAKASLERGGVAGRPKDLIVKSADNGQVFGTHPVNNRVSHGELPLQSALFSACAF